jgi:hypothetical protein
MRAQLQTSFSFSVSLSAHRPRDYVYFGIVATNSGLHYNSKGTRIFYSFNKSLLS